MKAIPGLAYLWALATIRFQMSGAKIIPGRGGSSIVQSERSVARNACRSQNVTVVPSGLRYTTYLSSRTGSKMYSFHGAPLNSSWNHWLLSTALKKLSVTLTEILKFVNEC